MNLICIYSHHYETFVPTIFFKKFFLLSRTFYTHESCNNNSIILFTGVHEYNLKQTHPKEVYSIKI